MTTTLGRWAWRLATASLLLLPAITAAAPCGGARHAVVIGINAYKNGVPPLRGARRDAERVAAALKASAFERKGDTAQQLRIYRDFIERFGDRSRWRPAG